MNTNINELSPHPKNSDLYGEIDDVTALVTSIEENGFEDSDAIEIVTKPQEDWPENRIVSGHRRWEAAKEVGLEEVPVRTVEFDDRDEELDYLVQENNYRQKTDAMLINEGYDYEQRHGDEIDGRTREAVAERIGKSGRWYRQGKRVKLAVENGVLGNENLDEETVEVAQEEWNGIKNGESSVTSAHQEIEERVNSNTGENEERVNSNTDQERVSSNTDDGTSIDELMEGNGETDDYLVSVPESYGTQIANAAKDGEEKDEFVARVVIENIEEYL